MNGTFFKVSGTASPRTAGMVFVWCRKESSNEYQLLGSGSTIEAGAWSPPPGISIGQFSVTFLLPNGCSIASVIVTEDLNAKRRLAEVTITACLVEVGASIGDRAEHDVIAIAPIFRTKHGEAEMAHGGESRT